MLRAVQHDNVREHNRLAVLLSLRDARSATMAELSRHTGLSVPTVTTITSELIALGVVGEGPAAARGGGRPARQVRLLPDSRHVLVLDLSGARLRAGRVDMLGELTYEPPAAGEALEPGPALDGRLLAWLESRLAAERAAGNDVSALAVAVPGVVHERSGHVRLAPALGWVDEPVGERLRAATGLPVLLENDVNAVALGELLHGAAAGLQDVLYLSIGSGIGAALVMGGALYRGANGAAGEVGYSLLPGLAEQGLDLGASGPFERHLLGIAQEFAADGALDLSSGARRRAFEALATEVRLALHNLACMLDPELIVVSWSADPDGLLAAAVAERWVAPLDVPIRPGLLGERAALHGAGQLALTRLTESLCGLDDAGWSEP